MAKQGTSSFFARLYVVGLRPSLHFNLVGLSKFDGNHLTANHQFHNATLLPVLFSDRLQAIVVQE